ncbi:response regulator [uncultured Brevundimonas sp.]|uniref:response regulator transcription factor n=1 Tax=uncultured Brevundimonas sp. TaxID=213418 RepID=UPI0030EE75DE
MRPHDPVVYVIDDDEPMRRSLVLLLSSAGYRVQTYEGPAAFLDGASVLEPGCVVTDMRMPQMSGLELMSELRAKGIPMPVILITGHGDVALAVEAMKRGAVDFLEKPFEPATLIAAIQKTIDNARVRFDLLADNRTARAALLTLSSREKDVLRGLVAGHTNKMIARELGISDRTVEEYRAKVKSKLGVTSLSALLTFVLKAES